MKKTRLLAIVLVLSLLVQIMPVMSLGVSAAANDTIVLYPEYPEKIEQDYMYRVFISQGGEEYEIPVYNSMRHANHYVRGDQGTYSEQDRRFCQFSATPSATNPVTVRIVASIDFTKCAVIPSIKGIASTVIDNEITFNLTESGQYVFRLNDNNLTNLAIFADAVETDVPNKNASNVVVFNDSNKAPNAIGSKGKTYSSDTIFYVEGWQEVEFFELQSGQKLYIAPGAVLNSRVMVMDGQSNITIFGRGMLRDFNDTRAYDAATELQDTTHGYNYLLTIGSSWNQGDLIVTNVQVKDILLFDSKGFNLVFQGAQSCGADGIKVISNEISTDGVSVFGSTYINVKNSFLYVNDNIFVIAQASGLKLDNLLLGSTIATFFPQEGIEGAHKYTNINVFRSTTIFEPASSFSPEIYNVFADGTVLIENFSAIDCVAANGGSGSKMGPLLSTFGDASNSKHVKQITFKNVTLPETANSYLIDIGSKNGKAGNYDIRLENVYVGSTAVTNDNVNFVDATTSGKPSTLTITNDGTYTPITKNETAASTTVYKTFIRDASTGRQYFSPTVPYKSGSAVYVSAESTAKALGFDTYFDADDNTLTIYDENVIVRATVGSKVVLYNDTTITLSAAVECGEEVMVPTDFFKKTIAPSTSVSSTNVTIGAHNRETGENLFVNGDFEDKNALESWTTVNFARLTRSTTAASGSYALRFADSNIFKSAKISAHQGTYQEVRDIIRENGAGVYRITFKAKANSSVSGLSDTSSYYIFATIYGNQWMDGTVPSGTTKHALTNSWQEYSQDILVSESGTVSTAASALYAAITIKGALDVSVDDITLTKVSDITNSGGVASYEITSNTTANGDGTYTLSYGTGTKKVNVTGEDSGISTLKFETTSDYIKLGSTQYATSGTSTKIAEATIKVVYPSNYDRTAKIIARNSAGKVVSEILIKIPAHTEDAAHVLDYTANLTVKETYEVGDTLDTTNLKLTNVVYNDGTKKTVTEGYTVEGADFSTTGEKTITLTYDNKSVTYTTTVVEGEGGEESDPELPNEANLVVLGASIRIADEELTAGLRFGAKISKNELYDTYYPTTDELKTYNYSEDNNYQFGAIMIPVSLIPDGETVTSLYLNNDANILDIPGKRVYEEDAQSIIFTGVLTGIPENFDGYTTILQAAFYVRYRESAQDEWTYIFSTELEDSYFAVAEKALEKNYNYTNIPNPTEEEKAIMSALQDIVNFVEEGLWIEGKWW